MAAKVITSEDVYNVMVAVHAQLETVLKGEQPITRAELAEYSKVVKAQAAPVLDPAKLTQQLLPELMAQLPKQLPLKIEPKTEEIVKLLSPVINRQVTDIQASNERLLLGLPHYLGKMDATLGGQVQDLEKLDESFQKTADRIPKEIKVNYVGGRLKLALVALGPLLFVLVALKLCGTFSKEPVATYNSLSFAYNNAKAYSSILEKQNHTLQQVELAQQKELNFYRNQVHYYRKKFPKSAPYLPPYLSAKK